MEAEQKFELLRSVGEECVTEDDLRNLVTKKPDFRLYDGFEPSGRMHIAQGIYKAMNVNKCTAAGGTFIFWVADWFALMNDKMGGDLEKIQTVGKYLIEVWKASGMNMERVEFRWSSHDINAHADQYWTQMLDIARRFTVARIKKCCQIMGRLENKLTAAQILYPLMQCTDIFFLKADVCQLGVDQRKVNMLAREYCDAAGRKLKPVILSHHMLYGLKAGQEKMSKSDPDSAIFMEDSAEDVHRKLMQAFCPNQEEAVGEANEDSMHLVTDTLKNPCLDYIKHIIFSAPNATFTAAGVTYNSAEDVRAAFLSGALPEAALKEGLVTAVNALLEPARAHFANDQNAKEILALVHSYKNEPPKENIVKKIEGLSLGDDAQDKPVFAVFAPPPTSQLSLATVVNLIKQLSTTPAGHQAVLWLGDWSAFVLNSLGGDHAAIKNAFVVLTEALNALAPGLMATVKVVRQSEAILRNPNDYWIRVINVGRHFNLEAIRDLDQANEQVGQVISSLMHVGDVLTLSPRVLCGEGSLGAANRLAADYCGVSGLADVPDLVSVPAIVLPLKQEGELVAGADETDNSIIVTDSALDLNRKVKKSFCEPQNVAFCPALSHIREVLTPLAGASFTVTPKGAEPKVYANADEVQAAYADGSLHPGDLKPALTAALTTLLAPFTTKVTGDAVVKKAVADLKNWEKKAAKKGGKK